MIETVKSSLGNARVLIVRVGAMGDVLHALPAVAALRLAVPEIYLGWVVDPRWRPLLSSEEIQPFGSSRTSRTPIVDRCFVADTRLWKRQGLSHATLTDLRSLTRTLRQQRFDSAVDMQGSLRSAAIGRWSGARRLLGSDQPRERPARWIYHQRLGTSSRHVVPAGCELLGRALGIPLTPTPVTLPADLDAEHWVNTKFRSDAPTILLAPTAGWGAKQWPAERFGAVARALADSGHRVLVNAASSQDPVANRVVEASGHAAELVVCSLPQLIALTRRLKLVLAGDTGPLHLAAALNVPVVGLYGPTDPARTGPWCVPSRVLRDPTSITDHKRHRAPEAGLLRIEVAQVIDAARELLAHV